jgi:ribose 1,5-bisphosphokinase
VVAYQIGGQTCGRIIAVVGPSGAGKDTLIAAAVAVRPELIWARRVITRPAQPGGEPYEGVDPDEFERRRARGDFALWWSAHGLWYGVPATVHGNLAHGTTVIFNGSRSALAQAREIFPALEVVVITAPGQVLADRLAKRGREVGDDIAARLARAVEPSPAGAKIVVNDQDVATGTARFLTALGD